MEENECLKYSDFSDWLSYGSLPLVELSLGKGESFLLSVEVVK